MKLTLLLLLISCIASAQSKFYIRADSTYILKVGGNNELILENGTRSVKGLLTNIGNGRTQFIASRRVGDTLFIGKDTILGINSGQRFGVTGEDNNNTGLGNRRIVMTGNSLIIDSMGTGGWLFRVIEPDGTRYFSQVNTSINKFYYGDYNSTNYQGEASIGEDGLTGGYINMFIRNQVASGYGSPQINLSAGDSSVQITSDKITISADSGGAVSGIFFPRLPYSAATTLQSVYRDSVTGKFYRGVAPAGQNIITHDLYQLANRRQVLGGFDMRFDSTGRFIVRTLASSRPILLSASNGTDSAFFQVIRSGSTFSTTVRSGTSGVGVATINTTSTTAGGTITANVTGAGFGIAGEGKLTIDTSQAQVIVQRSNNSNSKIGVFYDSVVLRQDQGSFYVNGLIRNTDADFKAVMFDTLTKRIYYSDPPTGGSGVTTMAAIGASPNANGATISGSTLNLEPADGSFGGVVTTGTQTFAGAKTFSSFPTFSAGTTRRIPFFTTGGLITDDANLGYNTSGELLVGTTDQGTFTGQFGGPVIINITGVATGLKFQSNDNYAEMSFAQSGVPKFAMGQGGSSTAAPYNNNLYFQFQSTTASHIWMNNAGVHIFGLSNTGKVNYYGASAITDGQVLLGHTANGTFEKGTITAGTGISVTNSAGSVTIAATGTPTSSFRTPTATNDANVDASTPGEEHYYRIGDLIHVWGTIEIDATAANTTTTFFLDFPVASAISAQTQVTGGQVTAQTTTGTIGVGYVIASVANDNALFNLTPSGTGAITYSYSYSYRVILP